ncbi:MAG: shikimate dehydrogenase [Flavisolibacter sp.]|nr:shikimate dehydrogenase [Flavisolibacter sp.]
MRLYGLIGKPLTHSFSQSFFTKKFKEEGITDCRYQNFELQAIEEVQQLVQQHEELKGFNITIPFKEQIIPYLHFQNEVVATIGACNCVQIKDKQLYGYNTDVFGFEQSLWPYLQPHHTRALVLGTGGAAKAVFYVLDKLNIAYTIVSRKESDNTVRYEALNKKMLLEHTIIINTSPVGMYPNVGDMPPIPYQFITSKHLLFDLIYNPEKTMFLQKGLEKGASVCNGYQMLVLQAEESWRIWNS